jgi:hypothetical protein
MSLKAFLDMGEHGMGVPAARIAVAVCYSCLRSDKGQAILAGIQIPVSI